MSSLENRVRQLIASWPGKRGVHIPGPVYDRMLEAGKAVTLPMWGHPPTPWQMQWLYDHGHTTEDAVKQQLGQLPHPKAKGLTVGEYADWQKAHQVYREHRQ